MQLLPGNQTSGGPLQLQRPCPAPGMIYRWRLGHKVPPAPKQAAHHARARPAAAGCEGHQRPAACNGAQARLGQNYLTFQGFSFSASGKSHQEFSMFSSMLFRLTVDSYAATRFCLMTRSLTRRLFCRFPISDFRLTTTNLQRTL